MSNKSQNKTNKALNDLAQKLSLALKEAQITKKRIQEEELLKQQTVNVTKEKHTDILTDALAAAFNEIRIAKQNKQPVLKYITELERQAKRSSSNLIPQPQQLNQQQNLNDTLNQNYAFWDGFDEVYGDSGDYNRPATTPIVEEQCNILLSEDAFELAAEDDSILCVPFG